jgi:hypothetical protein
MRRRLGPLVMLVAAALLAPSAQGVPEAGPGYVASFQVSYDSPPFPDTRYRVTILFSGDVCGDPFTNTWGFEATRTGGPSTPPPTLSPVTFAVANPVNVTADQWLEASGAEIARIEFIVRFARGAAPTITPSWETTGDIQNVVATPTLVPVTARTLPDCSAAQPPPPPPLSTPSGTASGKVLVNGRRYSSGRPIPFGSKVDVTDGRLTLRTELGTVTVYGGGVSSTFKLVRLREPTDLVEMQLVGGSFKSCRKRPLAGSAKAAAKPVRRLWAKGTGRFRTKGRYAAGTTRGTWWLTADLCDSTLVQVREGAMRVTDFVKKTTVVVKAPESYRAVKPR